MRRLKKKKKQNSTFNKGSSTFFPSIQKKIAVGKPNDAFEVEADSVADKVVNTTEPNTSIQKKGEGEEEIQQKPLAATISPFVQRMESSEEEAVQTKSEAIQKMEEEESVQAKEEESVQAMEEEEVQTKSNTKITAATPTVDKNLKSSKGSGNQMEKSTKKTMEYGFGYNFENVSIHTDSTAIQMNKELGAHAFTHGNDIYFNKDKYKPATKEGKHLLAHELTHTIQQEKSTIKKKGKKKCNKSILPNLRQKSFFRVQLVKHKLAGLNPATGYREQQRMMRLARKIVSPKIKSISAVKLLIEKMMNALSSDNNIICGPEIPNCNVWNAYVVNNQSPIHLCNSFFSLASEDLQIRILIHEAAHAAGIGNPASEQYIPIFDCETGANDYTSADAWAHFIHCATNQKPDKPEIIKGK